MSVPSIVVPVINTVPDASGKTIVRSAVGSSTVMVVSNPSFVAPSKVRLPSSLTSMLLKLEVPNISSSTAAT